MASVTIVVQDGGGRWDGAVTTRFIFDPPVLANADVKDLTQAQVLGLAVHGFLDMGPEKLESNITLEARE